MSIATKSSEICELSINNPEGFARLERGIQETRWAAIFTHPHFDEENRHHSRREGMKNYKDERDESLSGLLKEGIPVIILETSKNYPKLAQRIARIGYKGNAYVFVTSSDEPTPIISYLPDVKSIVNQLKYGKRKLSQSQSIYCWDKFTDLFKVKPLITISGQCLNYLMYEDGLVPKYKPLLDSSLSRLCAEGCGKINGQKGVDLIHIPYFCVGTMAKELVYRGLDVWIAGPLWPNRLERDYPLLKDSS